MSNTEIVALARALHILGGVAWAGLAFAFAAAIVPIATHHGELTADHWIGVVVRRIAVISGISALLSILSGIYLFATLHSHDDSAGARILAAGALAALLSVVIGLSLGQPAGRKLARLRRESSSAAATSPDALRQLPALRRRAALSAWLTAALLGIAVLCMAVFRYA